MSVTVHCKPFGGSKSAREAKSAGNRMIQINAGKQIRSFFLIASPDPVTASAILDCGSAIKVDKNVEDLLIRHGRSL
jgi:hypothetical protein